MTPAIDQKALPPLIALGGTALPAGYFGTVKVWPFTAPLGGGVPPVTNGISVKVLLGAVRVAAAGPVTVNWGDGTIETLSPTGHEVWGYHAYGSPGVRTVTLSGATTATKKINAGVVPTTTTTAIHHPDPATGAMEDYQRNPAGHAAGTSWNEPTPFCDGVLRQHIWLDFQDPGTGRPDPASSSGYAAYDVSFGGFWWDVSGSDQVLNINQNWMESVFSSNTTDADFSMYGQLPYAAGTSTAQAALDGSTNPEPTTSKRWLDTSSSWDPTLLILPDGKLVSTSGSSEAWVGNASLMLDDVLQANVSTPGAAPGAWPTGFDLEMIPVILP